MQSWIYMDGINDVFHALAQAPSSFAAVDKNFDW